MPLSIFPKERFVGIDIGHYAIKLAQLEGAPWGFRIVALGAISTPKDSVKDGVVTDQEAVSEAIRQCMRDSKCSASVANLAVAGGTVVVRTVKMPQMPEAALRKSIRFEAGRYVPSSVEDSYIECEILGALSDGQMEVLVAASPKDMVESRLAAARHAGLDVEVVDIEAFALYRALVEADQLTDYMDRSIALVDIGAVSTNVSVVDCGTFALTRSIPIGGASLTSALQNYFKMTPENAEDGKRALDMRPLVDNDGPMENAPLRVIQPLIDELVREIRRSLNYFHSQQTDQGQSKSVTDLILAGGGSLLPGLPEYLSHRLGLNVATRRFVDNPRFSSEVEEFPIDPCELAVAIGLAMRDAGRTLAAA